MLPVQKIGEWAFILGVLIAVVAGIAFQSLGSAAPYISLALVVLGLVVGFLNIGQKEIKDFLIAAIALLATSYAFTSLAMETNSLGVLANLFRYLDLMVSNISAFVAPAALVVALKAVYNLASKPSA